MDVAQFFILYDKLFQIAKKLKFSYWILTANFFCALIKRMHTYLTTRGIKKRNYFVLREIFQNIIFHVEHIETDFFSKNRSSVSVVMKLFIMFCLVGRFMLKFFFNPFHCLILYFYHCTLFLYLTVTRFPICVCFNGNTWYTLLEMAQKKKWGKFCWARIML